MATLNVANITMATTGGIQSVSMEIAVQTMCCNAVCVCVHVCVCVSVCVYVLSKVRDSFRHSPENSSVTVNLYFYM